MENKKNLNDEFTAQINNWKTSLEHLNTQLHLDTEKINDEFKKQKEGLNTWLGTMETKLEESKELSHEKSLQLKKSIKELRDQLNVDMAKTSESLKEQQENLNNSIQNFKVNLAEAYHTTEGKFSAFSGGVNETLNDYHTRFDLFKLRAHLAKKKSDDAWEAKKKELLEKSHALKVKLEQNEKVASEHRAKFSTEMSEAFTHFRKAFKH